MWCGVAHLGGGAHRVGGLPPEGAYGCTAVLFLGLNLPTPEGFKPQTESAKYQLKLLNLWGGAIRTAQSFRVPYVGIRRMLVTCKFTCAHRKAFFLARGSTCNRLKAMKGSISGHMLLMA